MRPTESFEGRAGAVRPDVVGGAEAALEIVPSRWDLLVESFRQPYPVSLQLIVFATIVPLYMFIPLVTQGRTMHVPEVALDQVIPLRPEWVLVYGSLYLFLIVLPMLVVREREHHVRTVSAYLMVWLTAYVCFLAYPSVAPRPAEVMGHGFAVWGLQLLYSIDAPHNCFPSIHVAHSFVSALTCYRIDRKLGIATIFCAALVAVSTVYCKQHYVLDVVAGVGLAAIAWALFLRGYSGDQIPESDRKVAPIFAIGLIGIIGLTVAGIWLLYTLASS